MLNFSSQLFSSLVLFCVVLGYSAYTSEESDSAIFFEYPHEHHHPHTIRAIDSRGVPDEDQRSCYSDSIPGRCVEIINCPQALKAVRVHKKHNFKRCGFHGVIEVICCPNDYIVGMTTESTTESYRVTPTKPSVPTNPHTRLNNRKCVQVCEEYSNEIKPDVNFYILEGENAEPKEFPHMVALGYNSDTIGQIKWGCGGSLISRLYVLTAAHCIINADQNPPVKVKMGMIKLDDNTTNPQEYDVVNITIHPEYKKWEKLNDIALIKLNKRVTYTDYVHPACLYDKDDDPKGMVVTGWGDTEIAGEGSNILQKAILTAVPLNECNVTYTTRASKYLLRSQICASDNKSDTCQGDSGGPLQVQNVANSSVYSIVGVTSYGIGCGSKYPGIYTRISSYLDWIESIVWKDS